MSVLERLLDRVRNQYPPNIARFELIEPDLLEVHPPSKELGRLFLQESADEVTLDFDCFGHHHYCSYRESSNEAEREEEIAEAVLAFFEKLFSDRVLLWTGGSSGWRELAAHEQVADLRLSPYRLTGLRYFLWSGLLPER